MWHAGYLGPEFRQHTRPEVGSTFSLLFWSQISSLGPDVSLCTHQGDFLRFPLLTSESYSGRDTRQYALCSGARLLFDLANTWEAFYKLIIPHCIHNVRKEIIKTPTRCNKKKKKNDALTSSLNRLTWQTVGAVGTWKLRSRACELGNAVGQQHGSRRVSFLFFPPRFGFMAWSRLFAWWSSGQRSALTGEVIKRLTRKTTAINLGAGRNETDHPRGAFVYFEAAWL